MKQVTNWENNKFYYNEKVDIEELKKANKEYRDELIEEITKFDNTQIWEARQDLINIDGDLLYGMLQNMATVDLTFILTLLRKRYK